MKHIYENIPESMRRLLYENCELPDSSMNRLNEGLMDSVKSLFGGKKKDAVDVKGLEKLARTNAIAFATAMACLTDEDKQYIIKNHPDSPIAKALPAYDDTVSKAEKAGGIQNVKAPAENAAAEQKKKDVKPVSKFNFKGAAGTFAGAQDRHTDRYSSASGSYEIEQGDEDDKEEARKLSYLFKRVYEQWLNYVKPGGIGKKYPTELHMGADGLTLKSAYDDEIPDADLKKLVDICSGFMNDEFGLYPRNWKIDAKNGAITTDVAITDLDKYENSKTPSGKKFAASKYEERSDTVKQGDDLLQLINNAKVKRNVRRSLTGVVTWLQRSFIQKADYLEGSQLKISSNAGDNNTIHLECEPNTSEDNAKKPIAFAVKILRDKAGLDVEFEPKYTSNKFSKYDHLEAKKIVIADEDKYNDAVEKHGDDI